MASFLKLHTTRLASMHISTLLLALCLPVAGWCDTQATSAPQSTSPVPQVDSADATSYAGQIKAAVQAQTAHDTSGGYHGRTFVEMTVQDTHVSGIKVVTTSGNTQIDRTARRIVANAHYPAPPADLAGIAKTYRVWVEFAAQ